MFSFNPSSHALFPFVVLIAALALTLAAHQSVAAPVGNEFQVNSVTAGGEHSAIAMDASGNFVIVWVYGGIHAHIQSCRSRWRTTPDSSHRSP